jgi:hypothetical protein
MDNILIYSARLTDDAAHSAAVGRRPKSTKERNRGRRQAVVQRALWGFEGGRRGERWQPAPLSALVGDVASHDWPAAGAGLPVEPWRSMPKLGSEARI